MSFLTMFDVYTSLFKEANLAMSWLHCQSVQAYAIFIT